MQIDHLLGGACEKLSEPDIIRLLEAPRGAREEIASAANERTRRRHGDVVTYVVNRNLNFSNLCSVRCHFCAFYRSGNHPEAFRLGIEDAITQLSDTPEISEVCVQGGIDDSLGLPYYVRLVEAIKAWRPGVHMHAFSPQEIHSLATREKKSVAEILSKLLEAGLDSMPGTAAEILDDSIRKAIAPRRLSVAAWEQVITTAHALGIPTSATMMFGHIESSAHRAAHLMRIRRLQEKTGGFTEFVPMPFMRCNTALDRARLLPDAPLPGGENAHIIAVSRLVLDDVLPNIQVSWVKNGLEEAGRALHAGANDLGGTLYEENITRLAGGTHGTHTSPLEFRRMARAVGLHARERTTLYDMRIRPRVRRRAAS